eukprot:TRINITY_DN6396_c0_g1_i1.p1 TRINITY_DN6396_c0_g1~~TRINITY_DN6396_c0_g1_i1.p1  ORF type:complete len:125 (-),score=11.90 TRINITY_DN6396_c0_g1_i1:324-647(-)
MEQPEGQIKPGEEHLVCLLRIALYVTHQAAREFYKHMHKTLTAMGAGRSKADYCLYTWGKGADMVTIGVYVDDLTLIRNHRHRIDEAKAALRKIYDLKDLGKVKSLR